MKLKRLTSGNIFKIIHESEVRYFQYFYTDQNYLGGDLIWVLNLKKETNDLSKIIESGYDFCFYTTVSVGVKMKKWELLGNIQIPLKMNFYPEFLWISGETKDWYLLKYDKKTKLGAVVNDEFTKIPFAPFTFPLDAVNVMIMGKNHYLKQWSYSKYLQFH